MREDDLSPADQQSFACLLGRNVLGPALQLCSQVSDCVTASSDWKRVVAVFKGFVSHVAFVTEMSGGMHILQVREYRSLFHFLLGLYMSSIACYIHSHYWPHALLVIPIARLHEIFTSSNTNIMYASSIRHLVDVTSGGGVDSGSLPKSPRHRSIHAVQAAVNCKSHFK